MITHTTDKNISFGDQCFRPTLFWIVKLHMTPTLPPLSIRHPVTLLKKNLIWTRFPDTLYRQVSLISLYIFSTESKQQYTEALLQFLTQQKDEAAAKAKEEERIKKEAIEKERQKIREGYVREWDIGKDGVEEPKKFREMTQEEYEEQQRSKRIKEFAPPQQATSSRSKYAFDEKGYKTTDLPSTSNNTDKLTWSDVMPKAKTPPPPSISEFTDNKGLYFSSTKNKATELKYKNFVKQDPVPIVNELEEDGDRIEFKERQGKRKGDSGTEIAPPPTYDYYGPAPKHSKVKKPFDSDIREAYAQGVKSLEVKESKRHISDKYDFIL